MPRSGETELDSAGAAPRQERKYRHNNVYQPTTTSKSFQRKLSTLESGWRKEGKKGKDLEAVKKEYLANFKKQGKPKDELKSAGEIAKSRKEKDQRRLKTGRHHLSAGKNKKK